MLRYTQCALLDIRRNRKLSVCSFSLDSSSNIKLDATDSAAAFWSLVIPPPAFAPYIAQNKKIG
jgi:hypothetical protein